jgi:signal transduction histidine kinase
VLPPKAIHKARLLNPSLSRGVFLLFVLSATAWAVNPNRQITQYAHTAWRIQDGFFNDVPTAVTQTTDGYLWIGTKTGLMRFDGVRFVPWKPNRFRVIACNNDGVWNEEGATLDFSVAPAWYQTIWFRVSCVGGFVLLLWALYQLRLQQLERQFGMQVEARVNERTRIARELHDTLLQSFQGLMLRFQTVGEMLPARPLDAKNALEGALDRADQAISEGRDAMTDIRASSLASRDLEKSITALMTNLSEELAADNGRSVTFRVLVEGVPRAVRPTLQDEIYRIARESLRNAFRHAQAGHIETEIMYGESLRLRFRDDGKGIDPSVVEHGGRTGHWGLPGIRERAKHIGAQLEVWSELGAGTEVELSIPGSIAYEVFPTRARFRLFRKRTEQDHEHRS